MTDFYIDHGAYTSALGTTPTWGVPQEGDGVSKDAATTSAVGSILFGSVPTSGAFSVCGITIGTAGVIGAASVGAAADALAGLINAVTTAVAAGVAVGTPQLRNLVYARGPTLGAPAGTCQIMMRVGSTTLNYASNASAAVASTFDGTPTLTQFVGGTGGCWGWFVNPAAIGVSSSIAIVAYGLGVSKPMVWTATPTGLDFIYCRTAAGKTINLSTNSFIRGAVGFPMNIVFDNNTKWTGDSGTGVFTLQMVGPGSGFYQFRPESSYQTLGNQVAYLCLAKGNLVLSVNISAASTTFQFCDQGGGFTAQGVKVTEAAAPASNSAVVIHNWNTNCATRWLNCEFDFSTYPRTNLQYGPRVAIGSGAQGNLEFEDCDVKTNLTGVPADVYPLFQSPNIASASLAVTLSNNRFTTNSAYKIKLFTSTLTAVSGYVSMLVQNNSGLSLAAAAVGIQNAAATNRPPKTNSFVFIGDNTSRHQRYEYWNGIAEWNPTAATAHPTLGSTQPDGTAYSIRMFWLSTTALTTFTPFSYRSSLFNMLAVGTRTITQHLFFDTTRGIDRRHFGIVVNYVDSTGIPRTERTHMSQDPVASGSTWTNAGLYSGFTAQKLTVTTAYTVKQYTEIKVDVVFFTNPPGSGNADVYVDPEFSIT